MNRSFLNKFALLAGLMSMFGVSSSKALKQTKLGETTSLAKYTENNFGNLSMKRVKGKWRVRK